MPHFTHKVEVELWLKYFNNEGGGNKRNRKFE